jgi:hypothetical protein
MRASIRLFSEELFGALGNNRLSAVASKQIKMMIAFSEAARVSFGDKGRINERTRAFMLTVVHNSVQDRQGQLLVEADRS